MNADRRIVPSYYVTSVLAEDGISERTLEVKNSLQYSQNKLHKVAHKWIGHDGINSLSRVMLKNVGDVPRKIVQEKIPTTHHETPNIHKTSGGESRKNKLSNYCAFGASIIGRFIGEILGYILKIIAVLMIFGPTRTAIVCFLVVSGINVYFGARIPVGLITGVFLIVHLIFVGAARLAQSNGERGDGGHEHAAPSTHGHH